MENYSYPASYPDSGDSSPRSREIEFENPPPPWDDQQQPPNYKAKFMCSYGGKIQPRSHDNQLSYVGGDTKILAVDLNIKFPAMLSKLSAISGDPPSDLSFKYQLPGEDLDALISVTNDDDLDHMMHEYDRLYRASARPARMRLFIFSTNSSSNSTATNSASDRFLDPTQPDPVKPNSNVDYLFGIEKNAAAAAIPPQSQVPPPAAVKFHDSVPEPVAPPPPLGYQPRIAVNASDPVVGPDPSLNHPLEVQRQLQRLQLSENDQAAYRRKSEEGMNYAAHGGDYYAQKPPDKFPPAVSAHHGGYWPEKHISGEAYPPVVSSVAGGAEPPVYVIPGQGAFYHAPVVRPAAPPPASQGYYAVQRMPSDAYREAPVYGGAPPPKPPFSSAAPVTFTPTPPVKGPPYTEGFGVVRPVGIPDSTGAPYAHVAYDSGSGRQLYYTAPGGVVHAPMYHGVSQAGTADTRPGGLPLGQDGKAINKVSQGSV